MKNRISLTDRIKKVAERDLMAELAIDLFNEGYRSSTLNLNVFDPDFLDISNCIRDLEINGEIKPNGYNKKSYKLKRGLKNDK